MLLINK